MSTTNDSNNSVDIRQQIRDVIAHFEHVLPGQAPLKDFVHHNTLHGYQKLNFPEALKAAKQTTGYQGYQTEETFRDYFNKGRINQSDLSTIINESEDLQSTEVINGALTRGDIYLTALLHPLNSVTGCQLSWQIEEMDALNRFQTDVSDENRQKLLAAALTHGDKLESPAIHGLWNSCLNSLNLSHYLLHPEDLVDLDPERAETLLKTLIDSEETTTSDISHTHQQVHKETKNKLGQLLRSIGHDNTLRSFLLKLTGHDILEDIRPVLQRHMANYLDQGLSAWHHIDRDKGFFIAWRNSARHDNAWIFEQLPGWRDSIDSLPDNAMDTILLELQRLGINESHWVHYLEQLALEIPGWSGLYLWRHLNPGYDDSDYNVDMLDYLAVRLVMERLYAQRLCRETWQLDANLDILRWYFRRRHSEFFVRYVLFNERLPEYLTSLAQRQIQHALIDLSDYLPWKHLADMIMTWRQSPMSDQHTGYTVFRNAWQLFRLAQHLGLCAQDIERLDKSQIAIIFDCLDRLDEDRRGFLWLQAYERHYREQIFNALVNNQGRGRWHDRQQRPQAQVVFCMDDREEGIRRHLEEHNPMIETLGAAGFFGVAINWKGLDDTHLTPLCPVVVTPAHECHEVPAQGQDDRYHHHIKRRARRIWLKDLIHQDTRRSLLTPLLVALAAPFSLLSLLGKLYNTRGQGRLVDRIRESFDLSVDTSIKMNSGHEGEAPTPENPQLGFTDTEQADRVQNFLRTIGLPNGFGNFVVMMGHGSISQNNPHLSAYDCGACSGRHGGPNARIFARMANRPEIRQILQQRGINIPDDTWFLGAEHNTCDETIEWYDMDRVPENLHDALQKMQADLYRSTLGSAHERCRRLASAPPKPSLKKALKHIIGRAYDISQARPELGHATNACAFIGRRSATQGAFFDRRIFLISYDPTTDDDEGHIIEAILLAAGPVGAGINLEYYFSTVNNDDYGSGSKVTHNVTGLFAVMDGTNSDLRTGLPKQMIEIHEAMRLQVVVEASTDVLTKIYLRQPALQELVGNGWLLLSAKDPDSEQISVFVADKGFVPWNGTVNDLPQVETSPDWYQGHHQPLTPALIKQETSHA